MPTARKPKIPSCSKILRIFLMSEKFGTVRLKIMAATMVIDIGIIRLLSLINLLIFFVKENLVEIILSII
jgi:hypothetical protein